MPKQIKAAVNTNVPTTKVDITAPVMPDIDSWKMAKDVKVQYSTDRTFVAEALLSCYSGDEIALFLPLKYH